MIPLTIWEIREPPLRHLFKQYLMKYLTARTKAKKEPPQTIAGTIQFLAFPLKIVPQLCRINTQLDIPHPLRNQSSTAYLPLQSMSTWTMVRWSLQPGPSLVALLPCCFTFLVLLAPPLLNLQLLRILTMGMKVMNSTVAICLRARMNVVVRRPL